MFQDFGSWFGRNAHYVIAVGVTFILAYAIVFLADWFFGRGVNNGRDRRDRD